MSTQYIKDKLLNIFVQIFIFNITIYNNKLYAFYEKYILNSIIFNNNTIIKNDEGNTFNRIK